MTTPKPFLAPVQGLRLFAALAVLFAHVQHELASIPALHGTFSQFTLLDGGLGVDVFFLISGFIMYHSSADQFGGRRQAGDFLLRRLLRIAPMYYLSTLLLIVAAYTTSQSIKGGLPTWTDAICSFLFVPYRNSLGQIAPILKLGWTLNYEMYFYLLFGAAMLVRRGLGLVMITSWLVGSVLVNALVGPGDAAWRVWFDPIVLEFLVGIGIARAYQAGARMSSPLGWVLVGSGLLMGIALRFWGGLPRAVLLGVPAVFIVAGVVLRRSDGMSTWPARLMNLGGDASYALYLFHPFVIRAVLTAWHKAGSPIFPHVLMATIVGTALAMAVGINQMVERPLNRWLRRTLPRNEVPLQQTLRSAARRGAGPTVNAVDIPE